MRFKVVDEENAMSQENIVSKIAVPVAEWSAFETAIKDTKENNQKTSQLYWFS